jgi:hypothetical protein
MAAAWRGEKALSSGVAEGLERERRMRDIFVEIIPKQIQLRGSDIKNMPLLTELVFIRR